MVTKFDRIIRSIILACNCFFRELHVIKFPDTFNKFVIRDVAGIMVMSLTEAQLFEAIMSIKDSMSSVILVCV